MKRQILLVDDDKEQFEIFIDALNSLQEAYNYKCVYANCAEQALQVVHHQVPDFIFLDYSMPLTDGLQLLSVMKADPKLKRSKIFLYSAFINEEVHKMAKIFGASGCVEKPNTISRLKHDFKAIFAGDLLPGFVYITAN